jgi:hypothetical protein
MDECGEQLFDESSKEHLCSALRGLVEVEQNDRSSFLDIMMEAFIDDGCPRSISSSVKIFARCVSQQHALSRANY